MPLPSRRHVLSRWLGPCALTLAVAACGGGGGQSGGAAGNLSGTASTGAPMPGASITIVDAAGKLVGSTTADARGNYVMTVTTGTTPLLLIATSADGSQTHLGLDYSAPDAGAVDNLNQISSLVTRAELLGAGMSPQTLANITAASPQAGSFAAATTRLGPTSDATARSSLNTILAPIADTVAKSDTALAQLLTAAHGNIVDLLLSSSVTGPSHTGLDNMLDQVTVQYATDATGHVTAQLTLPAAPAAQPVPVAIASVAALAQSSPGSAATAAAVSRAASQSLQQPPATIVLSSSSQWGTASDSWAGYTGSLALWVPQAVSGGWTLSFQSKSLGAQTQAVSFWGAKASYDQATHTFTLSNEPYNASLTANSVVGIGFSATGVLDASVDLSNCQFNGKACALAFETPAAGQATIAGLLSNYASVSPSQAATISGNVGTTLQSTQSSANQSAAAGGTSNTTVVNGQTAGGASSSIPLQVTFQVPSSWSNGYSGMLVMRNEGQAILKAPWSVTLTFPSAAAARDVFQSGPWNLLASIQNNVVTLRSEPWQADIAPHGQMSSGFGGGNPANILLASSQDANIVFDPTVKLAASGQTGSLISTAAAASTGSTSSGTSTGASTNVPPVQPAPPAPTPVASSTPSATGTAASFIFSPYKDVSTSMNWNTNVMSTQATGSLQPLLSTLPAGQTTMSLAFATGECGQETWGGVLPDAFAQANIPKLAANNINYIVSTGGAAGAFSCGTDAGMISFINRYASKNLVGIDFDIEAGQSASVINNLVQRVKAMQTLYPHLRWSFTLATLASSAGGAQATSQGKAAPDSFNIYGDEVMQAIQSVGLTKYTINLMVMDYGSAQPGNCVVSNGRCDMGQSAIQAAMNLHDHWGVPYSQIELTPMIGGNDVAGEIFSIADVSTVSGWAKSTGLAGMHFWSFDRDTDCAVGPSSATCNSYVGAGAPSGAGALGFDLAFLRGL